MASIVVPPPTDSIDAVPQSDPAASSIEETPATTEEKSTVPELGDVPTGPTVETAVEVDNEKAAGDVEMKDGQSGAEADTKEDIETKEEKDPEEEVATAEATPRRSTRTTRSTSGNVAAPPATAPKRKRGKKGAEAEAEVDEEANGSKKAKKAKDKADAEIGGNGALKILELGDPLPDVTLKNEKGEDVKVRELVTGENGGLVLFLVPKADTPGCTTQACGFRDIYPDFESTGFKVFCLSADAPTAQSKWQTKKSLPYSLLSDPKRELIKALGAGANNKTARSHFIFSAGEDGGKLVERKIPVKPAESPKLALEFIKSLGSGSG